MTKKATTEPTTCPECQHSMSDHGRNGCAYVDVVGSLPVPCRCGTPKDLSHLVDKDPEPAVRIGNYAGMPAGHYLHEFGSQILYAFDNNMSYLVGSATTSKTWRDVDIRLILPDEEYEALGLGKPGDINGKKAALEMAFAELGKRMTGLPIDFQIQQMTDANEKNKGCPRMALGFVELRMAK